jgi:hypothetical protein
MSDFQKKAKLELENMIKEALRQAMKNAGGFAEDILDTYDIRTPADFAAHKDTIVANFDKSVMEYVESEAATPGIQKKLHEAVKKILL